MAHCRWQKRAEREGYDYVIGIDEAGRGPVCGPVSVAAFCWTEPGAASDYDWAQYVTDSKNMSEDLRDAIFQQASQDAGELDRPDYTFVTCSADAEAIDHSDILSMTLHCMTHACRAVMERLEAEGLANEDTLYKVYIDGNQVPAGLADEPNVTVETVVKGDLKVFSISCASVIAKAHRDREMRELHAEYPQYGVNVHKGYLTAAHRRALDQYGPSAMHRLTFEPCLSMMLSGLFPVPPGRSIDCCKRKERERKQKKRR